MRFAPLIIAILIAGLLLISIQAMRARKRAGESGQSLWRGVLVDVVGWLIVVSGCLVGSHWGQTQGQPTLGILMGGMLGISVASLFRRITKIRRAN